MLQNIFLKHDWLVTRPNSAWASEIGDAGFRRDSRAGEDDDFVILSDLYGEFFEGHMD